MGGEAVIRDDLPIREILTAGALRTRAGTIDATRPDAATPFAQCRARCIVLRELRWVDMCPVAGGSALAGSLRQARTA